MATINRRAHDFYSQPAPMTSPGRHAGVLADLPLDLPELVGTLQALLMHERWAAAYGVRLDANQNDDSQIRPLEAMVTRLLELNSLPLSVAREPGRRLPVVCRHFAMMLTAVLRAQGVPARARCGFAGYFTPGFFEDHWVCEMWNKDEGRWILVDAQVDSVQRERIHPEFDLLDVPRDQFVTGGDAWARCRSGDADPSKFGLSFLNENGFWFIAANLIRDAASLNKMEMQCWDVWGAVPEPDTPLTDERLVLFDRVAQLVCGLDDTFDDLRTMYKGEDFLRVPVEVWNGGRKKFEPVFPAGHRGSTLLSPLSSIEVDE